MNAAVSGTFDFFLLLSFSFHVKGRFCRGRGFLRNCWNKKGESNAQRCAFRTYSRMAGSGSGMAPVQLATHAPMRLAASFMADSGAPRR